MAKKYLDDIGLAHLWDKIKAKITSSISDEAGKMIPYGYCTTASKTVAKEVTVSPAVTELETGLTIAVKFEYANGVANPTLNVNGTGAKAIKRYGTTAPSTSASSSWNANEVRILVYDGTYWQTADWLNTTYSSMSVAEYEAGTATTARLITPQRLKDAIEHWATGEANVQSDWEQTDSTADDYIKNKPTIPTVPTNVSAFTNDAGYITEYTETDPTVPAWAKASTKPSYNASEVGALANTGGEVTGDITLKSDANTNSKSLIFQRGTLTDNYNDWRIQDRGGFLYFEQRGQSSSDWQQMAVINTSGTITATTFNGNVSWSNISGKPTQLPTVSASDNGTVLRVVDGAWSAEALPSASGVSF